MNNELMIYTNEEFGEIRTLEINGVPWFVGKDVAEKLGYKNTSDALNNHVDKEDKADIVIHDGSQKRNMVGINESGLYSLILSSKLPTAKKFKRWITTEVLPSIRKTGSYGVPELSPEQQKANLLLSIYNGGQEGVLASKQLADLEKAPLIKQLEEQRPKVEFAETMQNSEGCVDVNAFSKILQSNGFNLGRNKLFKWLRDEGYLMKNNEPYQRFLTQKLFKVIEVVKGGQLYKKTLITTKGQEYLLKKIKKYFDEILQDVIKEQEISLDLLIMDNIKIKM